MSTVLWEKLLERLNRIEKKLDALMKARAEGDAEARAPRARRQPVESPVPRTRVEVKDIIEGRLELKLATEGRCYQRREMHAAFYTLCAGSGFTVMDVMNEMLAEGRLVTYVPKTTGRASYIVPARAMMVQHNRNVIAALDLVLASAKTEAAVGKMLMANLNENIKNTRVSEEERQSWLKAAEAVKAGRREGTEETGTSPWREPIG